jgi:hypothetical protein
VSTAQSRAARERKQKIFVAVGGVVLLGLVAIQLPGYLGGSSSEATSATTTTATTETPGPTTPVQPPTSTPVAVTALSTPKLHSFSSFTRKDPFVQQVKPAAAPTSAPASPTKPSGTGEKPKETTTTKGFTVGGDASSSVTLISVNGVRQALSPGAAFPASDPMFVLIAEKPGAKSVVVGVRGGAYASGAKTTTLKVGKPLVLVNTSTGARYRIVLLAVGDGSTEPASTTKPSNGTP